MRILLSIIILFISTVYLAFEGVVHGVKTTNGVEETFEIYIKGDMISLEGEDATGNYKIIIDRNKEEIFVCIDNPAHGQRGYYHFTAEQLKRAKKFQVLSSMELGSKEINGEACSGYSLVTDRGSVVMYASQVGEADLTGLSKYMDDPVYELIDVFSVQKSIRSIAVQKEETSYVVRLVEESKTIDPSRFEIPQGYSEYEIKLNPKK